MTKSDILGQWNVLHDRFSQLKPDLAFEEKQQLLKSYDQQIQKEDFWNQSSKAQKIVQERARLNRFVSLWQSIEQDIKDLGDMILLADESEMSFFSLELEALMSRFEKGEGELLLSGVYDAGNALLSFYVGTGGQDAEDFCGMLFRLYTRYAEEQGWHIHILDESWSDDGLKSATIEVKGEYAYGKLSCEQGVHRLIRLSPFNAKSLRQTSFARIEVLPEIDEEEIIIEDSDLRIDVFRSSGSGGQSVNTTDSAVRITYLPLNIVVTCQNEKSQLQNKESALKVLRAKLAQRALEEKEQKRRILRGDVGENSFGSQIRTYTLHPYKLVKDHRTDIEHNNPEKVFDGEIDGFIDAYLHKRVQPNISS